MSQELINFTPAQTSVLYQMMAAMAKMPPPKPQIIASPKEECVCKKLVDVTKLEHLYTGAIHTVNNVCKDCREGIRLDRTTSRIVCATCKRVVSRISPGKDSNGFKFEANKTYHLRCCGFCTPGLTETPLLEKAIYDELKRQGKV